jgi:hypothetical protein
MSLDQTTADEQSESRPGDPRFPDVPRPVEWFGHQRSFALRDAYPFVVDGHRQPGSVDHGTDDHGSSLRSVLERVSYEVREDLPDPTDVDVE